MIGRCAALGILLASMPSVTAGAADRELRIQVGDPIRYRIGDEKLAKAVVVEAAADWLRVADASGAERRLDKSSLQSLAALRGKKRHPGEGALIGFLPGAAFGAFAAGAMCDRDSPCNIGPALVVVGAMSAVLGAGVGALIKTDRWEEAPLGRVRFGIAPAKGGGVRAALTLSF